MLMMMKMMIMNCFCDMVDLQKALSLIFSRDYCQRSSPSRISDKPGVAFEPVQNVQSSGFVEWSWAVVITATPRCHSAILWQKIVKSVACGFQSFNFCGCGIIKIVAIYCDPKLWTCKIIKQKTIISEKW